MANQGVKGQTFAPFVFLLYLCIVFRTVEQASSTPYVQKKWRSKKKITIYLRKSNICCNFAASFQRKRRHSPSVVRRLHIFKANNTNWIHRNLANFQESQTLAFVSAHIVYYFCCICDSGYARASVKIQQKQYFFCICICTRNIII